MQDDSSEQIVSWVDGQIVTDWAAETAKRQRAIDRYLDDTDPARAEKYGFRSGQNPQLAWHWFRNNPVGFNGVPFVLFKTILDLDPDHENPTLRSIARIWKREAVVPSTAGTAATEWTLDHIGIGADPSDYVDGVVRPANLRQIAASIRLCVREPPLVRTAVLGRDDSRRRAPARAPRLSEHDAADCQSCRQPTRKRTGKKIGPASAVQETWIVCSSRARPATSGG